MDINEMLERLSVACIIGYEIGGGCDDCTATHKIRKVNEGEYQAVIYHDETCPFYRALDK